jgi:hypothetical protein
MFRLTAAGSSAQKEKSRFCVTTPRRTRDFFYGIMLLIVLGSATCTVLLTGTTGATFSSVGEERTDYLEPSHATKGYSASFRSYSH